MLKKVGMVLGVLGVLAGCFGCCCLNLAEAVPFPAKMSGEEMFQLCQKFFPQLETGKTLFVTTGEYTLFSLSDYLAVYRSISTLPPCRFKACLVISGRVHELHPLAAVGIAMGSPGISPAWFLILVTPDRKIYGLDPLTGEAWLVSPPEVAMLII
jgi:hypothetical protein